ncbi:MAG: hypothetical protein JW751_22890 [Polyangiaceae bacterium]|nr:hypothetical protein [Polyangiaceae bacterium]
MAHERLVYVTSSIVGLLLAVVMVASCGGKNEDSPPPAERENPDEGDAGDRDVPPLIQQDDCDTPGEVTECTVYLPEIDGVTSCFHGQQVCVPQDDGSGEWSDCADEETVREMLDEMGDLD